MSEAYRSRFPSTRRSAGRARRAIVAYAKSYGFTDADLADIESAIGEALANAIEHGHRAHTQFEVHVYPDGDAIVIEVQDEGAGFAAWPHVPAVRPPSDSPRGFGLFIMRNLMDEIEYSERGTRVRLKKRLPRSRDEGDPAESAG